MHRFLALALPALLLNDVAAAAELYREPFRPQFHFTPERNWTNDPNGLVFYEGEYHLFYQYNPHGDKWGHMSWGHAVSRDLVRWEHLPVALPEGEGVMIFSGSAVVDWKNSSGFGRDGQPPLVAIYTGHREKHQDQRLAFSNDRGRTWTNYEKNPVVDLGLADFRDPKVFWHAASSRWVMAVALSTEKKIRFFASPDLKEWIALSDFGPGGSTAGVWECPDLFPLAIEGESVGNPAASRRLREKWVLIVNVSSGAPAGGSGCQYFIGEFDGVRFVADPLPPPTAEQVPIGKVLADFEANDYAGWQAEGDAFGNAPAAGTLPKQQLVSGFRGKGVVNSFRNGDRSQGTLTSPPFEITAAWLSFLIGGGAIAEQTCMNLLVDGKVVRTATGREGERLAWQSWDLRELRGKQATLQIIDRATGGWGHINVDHIVLADEPARAAGEPGLWADFGPDFYAAVSWSDVPDNRRLWLGWMSNWQYAGEVPTSPWRGAMTLPRELTLRRTPAGLRLVQTPVRELQALRGSQLQRGASTLAELNQKLADQSLAQTFECLIELKIPARGSAGVRVGGTGDEGAMITCDLQSQRVRVDRTRSGLTAFHRAFARSYEAPLLVNSGQVRLHFFVDTSSIEVFADDGTTAVTSLVFPLVSDSRLELFGADGTEVTQFIFWPLDSIWK